MSATRPTAAPCFSCVHKVAVISADSCLLSLFVGVRPPAACPARSRRRSHAAAVTPSRRPPLAKVVAGVVERRRVCVA
jgi:hypothetical protein